MARVIRSSRRNNEQKNKFYTYNRTVGFVMLDGACKLRKQSGKLFRLFRQKFGTHRTISAFDAQMDSATTVGR